MAKKKKFKLPADSKSFIEGLVKPATPVEIDENEKASIAENALLIDTLSSIDKMLDIIDFIVLGLPTLRKYDHMKLQDATMHQAWLFNTYIGPGLKPAMRIHTRHLVNPDYREPETSDAAVAEEQTHQQGLTKVENNDHKLSFYIKHMVKKEPFEPLKGADHVSDEENLELVEYNAICVHAYHIMSSASLLYRLLKSNSYGVAMNDAELADARKFMSRDTMDYNLGVLSFVGYYFDMYLYLCNKMQHKPIDVKKIIFASRLHHQAVRAAIGLNTHASMCDTLIYFWKSVHQVLTEFKKEFPGLIDKHHQDKLVLFKPHEHK